MIDRRAAESGRRKRWGRSATTLATIFAVGVGGGLASAPTAAQDYYDPSTESVTVDLGAIGGGWRGPATSFPAGPGWAPRGGLLMPGETMPRSELHVPATANGPGFVLKAPEARTARLPAAPASAPETGSRFYAPDSPPSAPKPVFKPRTAAPAPATAPSVPVRAVTASPPVPAPPKPLAHETKPAESKGTVAALTPPAPPAPPAPPPPPPAKAEPAPSSKAPPPPPAASVTAEPPAIADAGDDTGTEQASLPPDGGPVEGVLYQVTFAADSSTLPPTARGPLEGVSERLKADETMRLQLNAYAGGKALSPSTARRLSLSRALSVRSFLIKNGVRSTRIDVRALGENTDQEPMNRVDVVLTQR